MDFTGDGRRDIWSEDPTDSLASTAAYLSRAGWVRGQPWGGEVGTVSGTPVAVLQPQVPGPRIAVFRNFKVIKRYNNSDSYAIGVGHLSDRIAGGAPFQASFGPDATGLTLEDRKDLQRRLTSAGYDTQGADGVIGKNTKSAISGYQRANGLPVTGEPSVDLLRRWAADGLRRQPFRADIQEFLAAVLDQGRRVLAVQLFQHGGDGVAHRFNRLGAIRDGHRPWVRG